MSVSDGQKVNASVTNAAFVSRTTNSDTVGQLDLKKPSGSGASVIDVQNTINTLKSDVTPIPQLMTDVSDHETRIDAIETELPNKIDVSEKGAANGVAELDAGGKVPTSQLPASVTTARRLLGNWDASTNTPTLADGTGTTGDEYYVDAGGTVDLGSGNITFTVGDCVHYDGSVWIKLDGGKVESVNGKSGVVTLGLDDINGVNLSSPTSGDNLSFNGTDWINKANTVDNLNNVDLSGLANKDILKYNSSATKWENKVNNMTDLSDVDPTGLANGNVLKYNSSTLKFEPGTTSANLSGLGDVAISGLADKDIIQYNSTTTKWENKSLSIPDTFKDDSTTTGSGAELSSYTEKTIRLSNASLVSLAMIPDGSGGKKLTIINDTGVAIDVLNDTGATASKRILTGAGDSITLENQMSINLVYDSSDSRWHVVGGTGAGTGGSGTKNYLSQIQTSYGKNIGNGNFEKGTTGWSLCTFASVDYIDGPSVTISNASPAVFTTTDAHGMRPGQAVVLTTTGTLPTGLSINTVYRVATILSSTTFTVSPLSSGNITTEVNTTSAGSGTHTFKYNPRVSGTLSSGATSLDALAVDTVAPLSGKKSLKVTNATSSTWDQGQGYRSDAFYIDKEDQAKLLKFELSFRVNSGAEYLRCAGELGDSLSVLIQDVDNGVLIEPYNSNCFVQKSGVLKASGEFQSSYDSEKYRFIIVSNTGIDGEVDLTFDSFKVGPRGELVRGGYIGNLENCGAITIGATTTAPTKGTVVTDKVQMQRIGDHGHFVYDYLQSSAGSAGSGDYLFTLPKGLKWADGVQFSTTNDIKQSFEGGSVSLSGSPFYFGKISIVPYDSTRFRAFYVNSNSSGASLVSVVGSGGFGLNNANNSFHFDFTAPVFGWGSNMVLSSDTDNRQVSVSVYLDSNFSASPSVPIKYNQIIEDTHGVYNSSSGQVTIPKSGTYLVCASAWYVSGTTALVMWKNNSPLVTLSNFTYGGTEAEKSILWYFQARDIVDIRPYASATVVGNALVSSSRGAMLQIVSLNNPQTIAATESISCSYYCSSNKSVSTTVPIDFDMKEWDTHNAVTTGSGWKFTSPADGEYEVSALLFNSITSYDYIIAVNGTQRKRLGNSIVTSESKVTARVRLNAGDYLDIRGLSASSTAHLVSWIQIRRVGIY